MKKFFVIIVLVLTVVSSCKKDDKPVFEKSADERVSEALAAYQSKLSGSVNGWKGLIVTDSGKGKTYSFYFKFNNQNRVQMFADFDSTTAVTSAESSYRLKALQQPSLIFDTYSYVHLLADPNPAVNNGVLGVGLLSDFEFAFDNTTSSADTIKLIGRINGSKAVLVRATKAEADAYTNKDLGKSLLFLNIGKYLNYFKRVVIGGVTYEIKVNQAARTVTFSWLDASGVTQTYTASFYYTVTGIQFVTPFTNGSQTIGALTNITWDAANTILGFSVNGTATTVLGSGQPLKVDLTSPRRWWQYAVDNGASYWISTGGVHKDGKDDFFDFITTVPRYQYMHFWPKYNISGSTTYDVCGIVYVNAAGTSLVQYGTAPVPTFTVDGRITFTYLGALGTSPNAPTTTKMTAATNSVRAIITQPSGFYLVQTGVESYDMVSALDGKTWISWEW